MTVSMRTARGRLLMQLVATTLLLRLPFEAIAQPNPETSPLPISVPALVASANPAVVTISTKAGGEPFAQGSGFNVDTLGVIITNYHVVKGASEISVKFPNGDRFHVEGLIAIDRDKDIAVLKISGFGLPTVPLGNSTQFQVGDQAVAIGSPQGFENTVSTGVCSGRRQLPYMWLIQTTAPISPGSSGGPLFGADGKVVGITSLTWVEKGTQSINFCVPINYARGMLAYPQPLPLSALLDSTSSDADAVGDAESGGDIRKEYDFLLSRIPPNSIFLLVNGFSDVDAKYSTSVCVKYRDGNGFRGPRLSELQTQRLLVLDRAINGVQDDEKTRYLRFAKKTIAVTTSKLTSGTLTTIMLPSSLSTIRIPWMHYTAQQAPPKQTPTLPLGGEHERLLKAVPRMALGSSRLGQKSQCPNCCSLVVMPKGSTTSC